MKVTESYLPAITMRNTKPRKLFESFGLAFANWLCLFAVAMLLTLASTKASVVAEAVEDRPSFDLEYGKHIVDLNTVVYCRDGNKIETWTCPVCDKPRIKDFEVDDVIHEFELNIMAFTGYSPSLDAFVFVFRGTKSDDLRNWIIDLSVLELDLDLPYPGSNGAKVHGGFYRTYATTHVRVLVLESWARLRAKYGTDKKVIVTGHSLGGALATFCALDLKLQHNETDLQLYTLGSPRVGNDNFFTFFHNWIGDSIRVVNNYDIVPSLPPTFLGYHHIAREVWSVNTNKTQPDGLPVLNNIVCDDSGEDEHCSDGACLFGICSSIPDHMTYLNIYITCGQPQDNKKHNFESLESFQKK